MPTCFCKLLLRTRQVSMALKRRAAATHQQGDSARAEVAADGVLEDPRPRLLARIVRRRLCWLRPFVASRIFVHLSLPLSLSVVALCLLGWIFLFSLCLASGLVGDGQPQINQEIGFGTDFGNDFCGQGAAKGRPVQSRADQRLQNVECTMR